ncbi:NAD-dependent epimerase/dehydratase family protein [bacterium]|nr:NAD-dependent epimerase/dehydratase family protein [bacterium]
MAKILVTGGWGFIGTNLTNELRSRGHNVYTLDILQGHHPQHYKADTGEFQQLEAIFRAHESEPFDFVYHLAAEYGRWNGEDHYQNLWRTNVVGTKNILRLQERYRFKHIFFSSAEVYGDYDGLMSEDVMERIPIQQMNDYAISKWAGELQCLNHADMFDVDVVRVRPVNCYGPHEYYSRYRGVIPIFVYKALHKEPFMVYRGHHRIFDYVDDTARTFANIVDNFIPGEVYNVGSHEDWEVTIEDLAKVVIDVTGADSGLVEVKGEEAFTTHDKKMDFSKIRRDLDHKATIDLEEGVRRYAEWMRKVYEV